MLFRLWTTTALPGGLLLTTTLGLRVAAGAESAPHEPTENQDLPALSGGSPSDPANPVAGGEQARQDDTAAADQEVTNDGGDPAAEETDAEATPGPEASSEQGPSTERENETSRAAALDPGAAGAAGASPEADAGPAAQDAGSLPSRAQSDSASPPPGAQSDGASPPPSPAAADAQPSAAEENRLRLLLGADFETDLGQGTFVANSHARNPYVAWLMTLRPMLMPTKASRIFVFQSISQELTDTDSDTRNRRVLLSDTLLGGRLTFYTVPRTKTSFNIGLIAQFPTSISSRYQTLRLALRPGLGLTQPIVPGLTLLLRTEFRKNFHAYTSPVGKVDDEGSNVFLGRQGGGEFVGDARISPGGNNISYDFWNRALLSYSFLDGWAANAILIVINGFTYEGYPIDDSSGVGAKAGRGQRDQAYAELSGGYTWGGKYTLGGGVLTQGSLTPADGKGIRFPFFDFSSTAQNLTSLFLRLSITYPLLGAPQKSRAMPNVARTQARSPRAF